jgi:hypothetical protein
LCSNCHRMVHAGALELPANIEPPAYRLVDILKIVAEGPRPPTPAA